MTATIAKHTTKPGVWCVLVPCGMCRGSKKAYPHHLQGGLVALDTVPGYDPRVPCTVCDATGTRILSTHATRDGAATSCNQVNQA